MIDLFLLPGRKCGHVVQEGRGEQYIVIERDLIGGCE
jgi:hypothetical protein